MYDYCLYLTKKDLGRYESVEEFAFVELGCIEGIIVNGWFDFDNEGGAMVNIDITEIEAITKIAESINDNILIGSDYLGGIDTINSLGLATCQR